MKKSVGTLVVGMGSPHGDDQAGWKVIELELVKRGLAKLPGGDIDFLFIENIGNLVCPASHDLAEHVRVVLVSTTEGDDKPGKYPKMFFTSQALVVSKTDLLPYVPFSVERVVADAKAIQGELSVMEVCALNSHQPFGILSPPIEVPLLENCAYATKLASSLPVENEVVVPARHAYSHSDSEGKRYPVGLGISCHPS